jgi:hypothetical protein
VRYHGKGVGMISVLIGVLIIVVIGAILFLGDRQVRQ